MNEKDTQAALAAINARNRKSTRSGEIAVSEKKNDPIQAELDRLNALHPGVLESPIGTFEPLEVEIAAIKEGIKPILERPEPAAPKLSIVPKDPV